MSTCVEQVINDDCLPCEFKNFICTSKKNKVVVRSDLKNMQDIHHWVNSFGKKTNTQWNVRTSCPQGIKIICSFHKIFDQASTQVDVFDTIAKPVVNSAIHGFNGTIFAYGQTGSGKTYAITGASEDYNQRGIIPRSIQQIFEFTYKSPHKCSIFISYLEIYNDIGYDLLNPKHQATRLEELPRVILLEDGKGESHLRNLSVLPVCTEQEAMRLLFLGDTNRTIAETPMNEYSSRSHCIFTIYISNKSEKTGKVRRSKLNLVDLAGSERIHKSNISGTTLNEAKHINLSLHYLEQVILALSQTNRRHIPYRNSLMTYMLRDSLSGNCLTAMIATLALNIKNLEETITTCKFAQRVALISTEAVINEEVDPQHEISYLRQEVDHLRRQLFFLKGINVTEKLTADQVKFCKNAVKNFLRGTTDDIPIEGDMRQIRLCFKLLKEDVEETTKINEEISKYKETIRKKDEEISALKKMLNTTKLDEITSSEEDSLSNVSLSVDEEKEFELYVIEPKNRTEIDFYKQKLEKRYSIARIFAETIDQCQKNIINLRKKMETCGPNPNVFNKINEQLISQQKIYRESIVQLNSLKSETDHLKYGMKRSKIKMIHEFRKWRQEKFTDKGGDVGKDKKYVPKDSTERFKYMFKPNDSYTNRTLNNANKKTLLFEKNLDKSTNVQRLEDLKHSDVKNNYNFDASFIEHDFLIDECKSIENDCSSTLEITNSYNLDLKSKKLQNQESASHISPSNKPVFYKQYGSTHFDNRYLEENIFPHCKTTLCSYETPAIENIQTATLNSLKKFGRTSITSTSEKLEAYQICDHNQSEQFEKVPKTLYKNSDSDHFVQFMKTIPLTGDFEVDDEIFNFYRNKFGSSNSI